MGSIVFLCVFFFSDVKNAATFAGKKSVKKKDIQVFINLKVFYVRNKLEFCVGATCMVRSGSVPAHDIVITW